MKKRMAVVNVLSIAIRPPVECSVKVTIDAPPLKVEASDRKHAASRSHSESWP